MWRKVVIAGLVVVSSLANAGFKVVDETTGRVIRHSSGTVPQAVAKGASARNVADAAAATEAWTIRSGDVVSETVTRWADKAGWQVSWDAQKLIAQGDLSIGTNFEEAISMVVEALNQGGAGIRAVFYEDARVLTRTIRFTEKK